MFASMSPAQYHRAREIAQVAVRGLTESSGLAASRSRPGVFWTHNDSGDEPWLYAFDRSGKNRGRVRVRGAKAFDWEALSLGPGPKPQVDYLYIGEIGDNDRARKELLVYRVPEPPAGATQTETAETLRFTFPDGPHDAEALMVHPASGDLYIVTKARGMDSATAVYKAAAPLKAGKAVALKHLTDVDLPDASPFTLLVGRISGGDISPDGKRVIVCDYFGAYEAVLPDGSGNFDAIWKARWNTLEVPGRRQGEAICYRHDGKAVLATSEGSPFPLIEAERQ